MAKEWLMEDWKNCAICKELTQIKDFQPNKVRGTYQYNRCRPCDKKRKADWNKENYERQYEEKKVKMKENPEIYKERRDKYKENNPEKIKELRLRWQANHAEYFNKKKNMSQNLRKSGVIEHLLILQDNKCMYCDKEFFHTKEHHKDKYSIDHYIPTKIGFDNSYSNLSLCCMECNFIKNHKLAEEVFNLDRINTIKEKIKVNSEKIVNLFNKTLNMEITVNDIPTAELFTKLNKNIDLLTAYL